jgi:hypothetical protein
MYVIIYFTPFLIYTVDKKLILFIIILSVTLPLNLY